jgi:hypothetical protein
MTPVDCDVLVYGRGVAGTVAATAAVRGGARTLQVGRDEAAEPSGYDEILKAILDEIARRAGVRALPQADSHRIVRHGRTIRAARLMAGETSIEVRSRVFVDTSPDLGLIAQAGIALPAALYTLTDGGFRGGAEFIDTMVRAAGPPQAYSLPYRLAVPRGLDNALIAGAGLSAEPEARAAIAGLPTALAVAHAVGTAAALLAATGQPADRLDPATLREKLRAAGAGF